MKKIIVKVSSIVSGRDGERNYYIDFKADGSWAYTINASDEGYYNLERIFKEAGYEVIKQNAG